MNEALLRESVETKTVVERPSKLVIGSFAFFFCTIAAITLGEMIGLLFR